MTRPSRAAYTTNLKAKWHSEELLPSHRQVDTSVEMWSFATPGAMFTELLERPKAVGLKQPFPMPSSSLGCL